MLDRLEKLESLKGQFWTVRQELIEDIEDLGFEALEENAEYIEVVAIEDEDEHYVLRLAGARRTIVVDRIEEI